MVLKGNTLILTEVDNVQFAVIKSWNKLRWDKKSRSLYGTADLELLDKLASIVPLQPEVEAKRTALREVADAVDHERMKEDPVPFYRYPVKVPLYAHQVRGANMCLLVFGWIPPERSGTA